MTPERWQQIKAVFEAVDMAGASERSALLEQLCEGDEDLRVQVAELLRDDDSGGKIHAIVHEAAVQFANPTHNLRGGKLGTYRLQGLIGSGGMGEVYAAEDTRLGRRVAIKILPPLFARDSKRVLRFEQEARAASALNHPNLVAVYDFGEAEGLRYIAAELVEGKTLRALIGEGPQPFRVVMEIAVQIAGALAAAHDAGITHRDIKPENIMRRPDGYIKILDFGLAKLREGSGPAAPALTATGVVMGTTAYMSPEQARGLAVDGRSDIFSAAVVLYELLCGDKPFQGKTGADLTAALLTAPPAPIGKKAPDVPAAFEAIVERCLRKDPALRYASAHELLTDLRRVQLDADSGALRTATQQRSRRRTRIALGIA